MQIKIITDDLIPQLEVFCKKALILGYENNSSLKAMKYDWCKEHGEFFCAIKDENIVAVAGCHPLPEVSENAWRILFRGCELPQNDTFRGIVSGTIRGARTVRINPTGTDTYEVLLEIDKDTLSYLLRQARSVA